MSEKYFEQLKNLVSHLPKSKILAGQSKSNGQYKFYLSGKKIGKIDVATTNQDAIIMGDGGTASIAFAKGKYSYSSHNFGFYSSAEYLTTEYIFRTIEQFLPVLNYKGFVGSGIKNIDKKFLFDLYIEKLPLPEQKKIASILTSVDEVIETTQKQIDKLQDLKKATMNELLTKGIGHTEFKNSELGRIPKSWEVKDLASVSPEKGIQTGPFGSQLHAHEYTTDGVPIVMPKDMTPPLVDISNIARIPEHRAIDLSKHRVKKGDILFSRRGDIGRFALMNASSDGWVCGTGCLRVRLKNELVHPFFVAQYLTKDEPKEWLNLNAVGLTMLNLSTSILEGLPLIVPPMKEQMMIVSALQSIDARLSKCHDYLSQTQALKKSLMQDLLTGKVRVQVN